MKIRDNIAGTQKTGATTGSNGWDIGYGSSWNVARMLAGIGAEMLD